MQALLAHKDINVGKAKKYGLMGPMDSKGNLEIVQALFVHVTFMHMKEIHKNVLNYNCPNCGTTDGTLQVSNLIVEVLHVYYECSPHLRHLTKLDIFHVYY